MRWIEDEVEYSRIRRLHPSADEAVLRNLRDDLEDCLDTEAAIPLQKISQSVTRPFQLPCKLLRKWGCWPMIWTRSWNGFMPITSLCSALSTDWTTRNPGHDSRVLCTSIPAGPHLGSHRKICSRGGVHVSRRSFQAGLRLLPQWDPRVHSHAFGYARAAVSQVAIL